MGALSMSELRRPLILEIALPDYYLDDWDEIMGFYAEDGEDVDAPEVLSNESGLCSSRVNLSLLLGDKGGTYVEHVKGQIVNARVVPRKVEHELSDDDRLDTLG